MNEFNLPADFNPLEPKQVFTYYAVSEGDFYEVTSQAGPENYHSLRPMFNLTSTLETDDAGAQLRNTKLFPDGHMISPFRPRCWTLHTRDELRELNPTPEEQAAWKALHEADERRVKDYASQSAIWFEALGRYVASFENLIGTLSSLIRASLKKGGLKELHVREMVVADLAAQDILKSARMLFHTIEDLSVDEGKVADAIFARVQHCIEARNDVVHSSWRPGGFVPAVAEEFLGAQGEKFIKGAKGSARRRFEYTNESLRWLQDRCDDARVLCTDLWHRVTNNRRPLTHFLAVGTDKAITRTLNFLWTKNSLVREEYMPSSRFPPTSGIAKSNKPQFDILSARYPTIDELVECIIRDG